MTGELLLGQPKSRAGRRIVGIPGVIDPALREHLAIFVNDEPGSLEAGHTPSCRMTRERAWLLVTAEVWRWLLLLLSPLLSSATRPCLATFPAGCGRGCAALARQVWHVCGTASSVDG